MSLCWEINILVHNHKTFSSILVQYAGEVGLMGLMVSAGLRLFSST